MEEAAGADWLAGMSGPLGSLPSGLPEDITEALPEGLPSPLRRLYQDYVFQDSVEMNQTALRRQLANLSYGEVRSLMSAAVGGLGGLGGWAVEEGAAPPAQTTQPAVLAIAGLYTALLLLGLPGNSSMAAFLLRLLGRTQQTPSLASLNASFLHLLALSLVDLVVVLALPFAISDLLLGHWIFGPHVCKLYWLMESGGKIMSTFILCMMSQERWSSVCRPGRQCLRSRGAVVGAMGLMAVAALALLSPLAVHATVDEETYLAAELKPDPATGLRSLHWRHVRLHKCRIVGFDHLRSYTLLLFSVGFLAPFSLISFFYGAILRRVSQHRAASSVASRVSLGRVTLHSLSIVLFYALCWGPYWAFVLYNTRHGPAKEPKGNIGAEGDDSTYVYAQLSIHALPFLNSAANWVLYALLNSQLKRKKADLLHSWTASPPAYRPNSKIEVSRHREHAESFRMSYRTPSDSQPISQPIAVSIRQIPMKQTDGSVPKESQLIKDPANTNTNTDSFL